MNLLVIGLVLGAAFSHALWNMLLKKTDNRLLMMTAMHSMTGIMGLIFLPFLGTIHVEAWNLLLLSVAVHGGYYVFLTYSYRHIELGQAYTIIRGSGPLIVFLASLITGWLCIAAITSISALIIQINLCQDIPKL